MEKVNTYIEEIIEENSRLKNENENLNSYIHELENRLRIKNIKIDNIVHNIDRIRNNLLFI